MISAEVTSVLNRLRGQGSDFEFLADVLQDALSAQTADFVGYMTLEAPETTANVEPPDYPNLDHDLPAVITIRNRHAFFKPGDQGPSGGYTERITGPICITPNRPDDVTVHTPDGTIICSRLILNGTEIVVEDCP